MAAASSLTSAFLSSSQVLGDKRHPPVCSLNGIASVVYAQSASGAESWSCKSQDLRQCWIGPAPEGDKVRLNVQAPAVKEVTGSILKAEGLKFGVVAARFNEIITRPLLAGALETFQKYGVAEEDIDVVWVPGSFELPVVSQALANSGKYQAILCIGAVIRGATSHYDAVANSAASGIMSAGLNTGVPCIFGVLTCDSMEQAIDRAGGKAGNKGAECALTAIEVASLFNHSLASST